MIQMKAVPLEELNLKAVNTVGCGDAFIGAFASALVEGKGHIESLRRANAAGGYKATRIETRGGPTREQLEHIISLWKRL
jgi:sugar/nucleoside kinase (ribokinase family)